MTSIPASDGDGKDAAAASGAATSRVEDDDLLAAYLAQRDEPCPRCGYSLRGLGGRRCPECGDVLTLRIGLVEPRWGAYVTLLSVASFGLGASALLGVLALLEAGASWWGSQAGILLLVQWVFTGVLVPLTLLVRRRIRRLPRTVQWGLALIVLAAVLSMSGSIIILFDG